MRREQHHCLLNVAWLLFSLRQVSRRYYNSHALVDVVLAAEFDPPLREGVPSRGTRVRQPRIVVSTPTTISKGAHNLHESLGADYNPCW
jgi:hypothetical protein